MSTDPRFQDVSLLAALAAYRIQQRRQHEVPNWKTSVGMSALLEAARYRPRYEPGADLEGGGSMGQLLAEARARAGEEHRP